MHASLPLCTSTSAAFRLRHVQSVTLKHFDPGTQGQRLPRDALLHYELWRGGPDCEQQLLYVSEQVGLAVGCADFGVQALRSCFLACNGQMGCALIGLLRTCCCPAFSQTWDLAFTTPALSQVCEHTTTLAVCLHYTAASITNQSTCLLLLPAVCCCSPKTGAAGL